MPPLDDEDSGVSGDIIDAIAGLPDSILGQFDDRGEPMEAEPVEEPEETPAQSETVESEEGETKPEHTDEEDAETAEEAETDEQQSKKDEKGAEEQTASSEDDFIEVPSADGGDPERIPVAEAVESHRQLKALNGDLNALRNQLETAFAQKMNPVLEEQIKARDDYIKRYEHIKQWTAAGREPDPDMLDRMSDKYDPDRYHLEMAQFRKREAAWKKADAEIETERKKLEADRKQADEARISRERANLQRVWPALYDPKEGPKLLGEVFEEISKAYGYKPEELVQATDHRQWLMARDALAYRKMKAGKGEAVVKKAAAKLVKSQAKASPAGTASARTKKARDALRKVGSIEAAAAAFEGLDL